MHVHIIRDVSSLRAPPPISPHVCLCEDELKLDLDHLDLTLKEAFPIYLD